MKKVSVIVPVYNMERYLERCLDSLVEQTLDDIEIIAVNDGSTDKSEEILKVYQEKYPEKVKVFSKTNGGQSEARNYGIGYATGEYIGFVDSDDYVETDMFDVLYRKAAEKQYDMVVCDYWEVRGTEKIPYTSRVIDDGQGKNYIKEVMLNIYSAPWNKIYKRKLIVQNLFKCGVIFEDVEFLYRLLPSVNSIGTVHKYCYNYIIREGSTSNSTNLKIYDQVSNWNGLVKFYKEEGIFEQYCEELEYCYVRYLFALFVKSVAKFEKQEFDKAVETAILNVREYFPNYKSNFYLKKWIPKNIYLKYFNKFFALLVYKKNH